MDDAQQKRKERHEHATHRARNRLQRTKRLAHDDVPTIATTGSTAMSTIMTSESMSGVVSGGQSRFSLVEARQKLAGVMSSLKMQPPTDEQTFIRMTSPLAELIGNDHLYTTFDDFSTILEDAMRLDVTGHLLRLASLWRVDANVATKATEALINVTHQSVENVIHFLQQTGCLVVVCDNVQPHVWPLCMASLHVLGNIVHFSNGSLCRNVVESMQIAPRIAQLFQGPSAVPESTVRAVAEFLQMFLCHDDPAAPETVQHLLPVLHRLVAHDDMRIVNAVAQCWSALFPISNDYCEAFIRSGLLPRLVSLLGEGTLNIVFMLSQLAKGHPTYAQHILDANGAVRLLSVLFAPWATSDNKGLVCWALLNISVASPAQLHQVLQHGPIIPLIELYRVSPPQVRIEITWLMAAIGQQMVVQCISLIPLSDLLQFYVVALQTQSALGHEVLLVHLLQAINHILLIDGRDRACLELFVEQGGADVLRSLQNSNIENIAQMALLICDSFLDDMSGEHDGMDSVLLPAVNAQGYFQFGLVGTTPCS